MQAAFFSSLPQEKMEEMGSLRCNNDRAGFSQSLPWIGLCVAAASLTQAIAMFIDALHSFGHRKLWVSCRFFSLNIISSTLMQVSTLLASDLNTTMPRCQDQLAKLSGPVLTCISMAYLMPSLGTVPSSQIGPSMLALGVFVFTVILSASIQMATGVIYAFLPEHAAIMFLMLVLFAVLSFSALIIPTMKQLLEQQYSLKSQQASRLDASPEDPLSPNKLKVAVTRHWMMAHTCNPQYVVARSVTSAACGVLCLLCDLLFMEALLRSLLSNTVSFCDGMSDYKWSSMLVLISQTIAILVGSVAPVFRWFHAIGLRKPPPIGKWSQFIGGFQVEQYWVQRLVEWKERPLPFYICTRRCRKFIYILKNAIMCSCLHLQITLVLLSKVIYFASVLTANLVKNLSCCKRFLGEMGFDQRDSSMQVGLSGSSFINFVLLLEGESTSVDPIIKGHSKDAEKWISWGMNKKPAFLMDLLKKSTISQRFKGTVQFDSDKIPWLGPNEQPSYWALPIVTLMSIIIAIAYSPSNQNSIECLILGVNEGLKFVTFVEKKGDGRRPVNATEAANIAWLEIDLFKRWLDLDLRKLAFEEKSPLKILQKVADSAKLYVEQNSPAVADEQNCPLKWPAKLLAADSMYKISLNILQHCKEKDNMVDAVELMEFLQIMIADIFVDCLTHLPRTILRHCSCSTIKTREASVREAAYLLGQVADIIEYLGQLSSPGDLDP